MAAAARATAVESCCARRFNAPLAAGDVLLLDGIGDLGAVYASATLAFVGGTLVPVGVQSTRACAGRSPRRLRTAARKRARRSRAPAARRCRRRRAMRTRSEQRSSPARSRIGSCAREAGRAALAAHHGSAARSATLVESMLSAGPLLPPRSSGAARLAVRGCRRNALRLRRSAQGMRLSWVERRHDAGAAARADAAGSAGVALRLCCTCAPRAVSTRCAAPSRGGLSRAQRRQSRRRGIGKTPAAAWIASQLRDRGHRTAIASRATDAARAPRWSSSATAVTFTPPCASVDEPLLLAGLAPGVPVVVGPGSQRRGTARRRGLRL